MKHRRSTSSGNKKVVISAKKRLKRRKYPGCERKIFKQGLRMGSGTGKDLVS